MVETFQYISKKVLIFLGRSGRSYDVSYDEWELLFRMRHCRSIGKQNTLLNCKLERKMSYVVNDALSSSCPLVLVAPH